MVIGVLIARFDLVPSQFWMVAPMPNLESLFGVEPSSSGELAVIFRSSNDQTFRLLLSPMHNGAEVRSREKKRASILGLGIFFRL